MREVEGHPRTFGRSGENERGWAWAHPIPVAALPLWAAGGPAYRAGHRARPGRRERGDVALIPQPTRDARAELRHDLVVDL